MFAGVKDWADKIFKRFTHLRTDYHKIATRGKLGRSGSGKLKGLTALQKWKSERYSFLQPYYKQGQKAAKESQGTGVLGGAVASSDHFESDEDLDEERAVESSSSAVARKGKPEDFGALTSPPSIRRTEKRSRDKDKEERESHFDELMSVMKESASHLVS